MEENIRKKTPIVLFAIAASIILYLAGVFSGLYANKLVKDATEKDILRLRESTSKDLQLMQNYVDFLDSNLKDMQLEYEENPFVRKSKDALRFLQNSFTVKQSK